MTHRNGPLVSIPYSAISKVVKVSPTEFEVPKNRNELRQKELFAQMFEIKLQCEYEDIYLYREVEKVQIA